MKNKISLLTLILGLAATSAFASVDCDNLCGSQYEGFGANPTAEAACNYGIEAIQASKSLADAIGACEMKYPMGDPSRGYCQDDLQTYQLYCM